MANMHLSHQSFPCSLYKNVKKTTRKYNAGCRQHNYCDVGDACLTQLTCVNTAQSQNNCYKLGTKSTDIISICNCSSYVFILCADMQ